MEALVKSVDKRAAYNMRFGKKLADTAQHQLLVGYSAAVLSTTLQIGGINNNEHLIINLAAVQAGRILNTSSSPSRERWQ